MDYATRDDLNDAFGHDQVERLAARPDVEDDAATVARALSHASGVIDASLSVRFTLPLPSIPDVLRDIACDIAIARLASDSTGLTDDLKRREDQAEKRLAKIAKGEMNLGLPAASEGDRPQPIVASTGGKLFTRDSLRRF
jgi:phage gp36-like protein